MSWVLTNWLCFFKLGLFFKNRFLSRKAHKHRISFCPMRVMLNRRWSIWIPNIKNEILHSAMLRSEWQRAKMTGFSFIWYDLPSFLNFTLSFCIFRIDIWIVSTIPPWIAVHYTKKRRKCNKNPHFYPILSLRRNSYCIPSLCSRAGVHTAWIDAGCLILDTRSWILDT